MEGLVMKAIGRPGIGLIVSALLGGLLSGADASAERHQVSWEEVRTAIAESICVGHSSEGGQDRFWIEQGLRERCGFPAPASAAERAVAKAYATGSGALYFLGLDEPLAERLGSVPQLERDVLARETYLGDERVLRIYLRRIEAALGEESLACDGCPTFEPLPVRTVSWDTVAPYLGAYVWPRLVERKLDADGKPTGPARVRLSICPGINGISEIDDPDPEFVRLGYLLAVSRVVQDRAGELLVAMASDPGYTKLETDEDKTRYLQRHLPREITEDRAVRRDVCDRFLDYTADLGLTIEECHLKGEQAAGFAITDCPAEESDFDVGFGLMQPDRMGRIRVSEETTTIPLETTDPDFLFGFSVDYAHECPFTGSAVFRPPAEGGHADAASPDSGVLRLPEGTYVNRWWFAGTFDEDDVPGIWQLELTLNGKRWKPIEFTVVAPAD
jgi:hypothetical protein